MTITIQQSMLDLGSLSEKTQLILELIPNGVYWTDLSASQATPNYTFQSEPELVLAVLDGLHDTRILYIPNLNLFVDPEKLYALTETDLRVFVKVVSGQNLDAALLICERYDLQTNTELKPVVSKLLTKCGVSSHSLFHIISLADMLSLATFAGQMEGAASAALLKEASNHALRVAQTPIEFADLVSLYVVIVDQLSLSNETVSVREKAVNETVKSLNPFAMEMLGCPQISGSTSAKSVDEAVTTWLDCGNSIGFCSNARALLQLARNLDLTDLQEPELSKSVADYLGKTQVFLRSVQVQSPVLRQDGGQLNYAIDSDNPLAQISVDPLGCLLLDNVVFH